MKRRKMAAALAAAAVLALGCAMFAACEEESSVEGVKLVESTSECVVIEATETGGSLYDAMVSLKEEELIAFEGSMGDYGFFIESVNGTVAGEGQFWALYTSLGDYEGVSYSTSEYGTYEYEGTDYASANYGCEGLPLVSGNTYIIVLSEY